MMFAFAIVQFIFWTIQCYCCCLPLIYTPVKDHEAKKEQKKEEKKNEKEMKQYQKTM